MKNKSENKKEIFQVKINEKSKQSFNSFFSAIEYMIRFIQEELMNNGMKNSKLELLYQQGSHIEHLVSFPKETGETKKYNVHPYLQSIMEKCIFDEEGYIHEINHNLLVLDELINKKYTVIRGNDNFLDLIKYIDITEYSLAYCPNCKSVQHCTIEGCDGLISFTCDNCKGVTFDAFRNKEIDEYQQRIDTTNPLHS